MDLQKRKPTFMDKFVTKIPKNDTKKSTEEQIPISIKCESSKPQV